MAFDRSLIRLTDSAKFDTDRFVRTFFFFKKKKNLMDRIRRSRPPRAQLPKTVYSEYTVFGTPAVYAPLGIQHPSCISPVGTSTSGLYIPGGHIDIRAVYPGGHIRPSPTLMAAVFSVPIVFIFNALHVLQVFIFNVVLFLVAIMALPVYTSFFLSVLQSRRRPHSLANGVIAHPFSYFG